MKKEDKLIFKELEKKFSQMIRLICKEYKYKVINGSVYFVRDDFFFNILPYLRLREDKAIIRGELCIKPMKLDDIFWDVFDMQSNKNAPLSLRVNGAFVLRGLPIATIEIYLRTLDEVELNNALHSFFNDMVSANEKIECSLDSFIKLHTMSEKYYQSELVEIFCLILKSLYVEALNRTIELLDNGDKGRFCNHNKWINEYIVDYCNDRITNN